MSGPNKEIRWKYVFADIVYITDETSTKEITSYALELPLDKRVLTARMIEQYEEAKRRLLQDPTIITSHHVCIVDMSASMRQSDLNGHKSRYRAVYYSLAVEYIAAQMQSSLTFTGTDVVTLIEMHDNASVVFEKEPMSWALHNKFVELSERSKRTSAFSHGNYLPSIREAIKMLKETDHSKCTPSLFFLSDGRASDSHTLYKGVASSDKHFMNDLLSLVESAFQQFSNRLTIVTCGYGTSDFTIMKSIIEKASSCGAKNAKFLQTSLDPDALSKTMSSIISSTTETRNMLTCLFHKDTGNHRKRTNAQKDIPYTMKDQKNSEWRVYQNKDITWQNKICECYTVEKGSKTSNDPYKQIPFKSAEAVGIMVKKNYFGEGAERVVFEMCEIDSNGIRVGQEMVAKESKYIKSEFGKEKFHASFVRTQQSAASLAKKFNKVLNNLGVKKDIPRVSFLECCIYYCFDDLTASYVEFLAEKRLNQSRYIKWNDNSGGVYCDNRVDVGQDNEVIEGILNKKRPLETIEEGGELSDEDSIFEEIEETNPILCDNRIAILQTTVMDKDVPQAFSHWTHFYTKRNKLVCDIQGELVKTSSGGYIFELTDPCIHTRKSVLRKYGNTNKEVKGINQFFKTHKCNALCEILKISNINK